MLGLGVNAHAGVTLGLFGLPLVMPDVQRFFAVSLPVAGLIANAPAIGVLFALVPWGALADRRGERLVLGAGVGLAAVFFAAVALVSDIWAVVVLLALAGAAGSAAMVGGGRIVLRWFEPPERGVAMEVRQVSYTLGMAVAAFVLPPVSRAYGLRGVLAAALAALFLAGPPRRVSRAGAAPTASPYRQPALWRVHATSALQLVPQAVVGTYGVMCLVEVYGWDGVRAGQLFGVAAIGGAVVRVAVGRWSDRSGLRMAPLRRLTYGALVRAGPAPVRGVLRATAAERGSPGWDSSGRARAEVRRAARPPCPEAGGGRPAGGRSPAGSGRAAAAAPLRCRS